MFTVQYPVQMALQKFSFYNSAMNTCTGINITDQLSVCNEIGQKITYLTNGLKTTESTQLIFLSFVLRLLGTEMKKRTDS